MIHWIKSATSALTGVRYVLWQIGDYQYQIDDDVATVKILHMPCEEAIMEFNRIVGATGGETI